MLSLLCPTLFKAGVMPSSTNTDYSVIYCPAKFKTEIVSTIYFVFCFKLVSELPTLKVTLVLLSSVDREN